MDTQSVWDSLAGIPVGTIVTWISVIIAIVSATWVVIIKLYHVFAKYRDVKEEDERQKKLIAEHDELLMDIKNELVKINGSIHNDKLAEHDELFIEIRNWLSKVNDSLEEQKEINFEYLKHSIVFACQRAISHGSIAAEELQSIEDMYKQYVEIFHGNGYVATLVEKMRALPVVGSIEE